MYNTKAVADYTQLPKILEILQNEGGQITHEPGDLHTAAKNESQQAIVIVPSEWTISTGRASCDRPEQAWLVTEWWIERCIVSKSIVNPENDFYSRPRLNMSKECTYPASMVMIFAHMLQASKI